MKTIDRIFIGALVLIVCACGLWGVNNIYKPREAINVVGEGKVEVKADRLKLNLNMIFSGEDAVASKKRDEALANFQNQFEGVKITAKNTHMQPREHGGCYIEHTYMDAPCLDAYFTVEVNGDAVLELGKAIETYIDQDQFARIQNKELSVSDKGSLEATKEARMLAMQDAKTMAQKTANQLGVKLGRLLQSSEYGLAQDDYYHERDNYIYSKRFYDGERLNDDLMITIIRKAYLTYDID